MRRHALQHHSTEQRARPARHRARALAAALAGLALTGVAATLAAPGVSAWSIDASSTPRPLHVALKWSHQTQFAGWYAAIDQGEFERRGLDVTLEAGVPGVNPIDRLRDGTADVAEASMDQAVAASTTGDRFVNVAQLFQRADSLLICRTSERMLSARDLRTATISVGDRRPIVEQMIRALHPEGAQITYIDAQPSIAALTSGAADCQWGSTFNEYWRAEAAGLRLFVVDPEDVGVVNIEDGLYVKESRLADDGFRAQLADMLVGLQAGWAFSADQPSAAVQLALLRDPELRDEDQRRQLEAVLPLLGDRFGYFDIGRYERVDRHGVPVLPVALADRLWTHEVYDAAQAAMGHDPTISPVTRHYVEVIRASPWYHWLVGFGTAAAAAAGALLGLRLGYRFWGRLVLATITALGGGLTRDIILGGSRYPTYLVHDPRDLFLVFGVAVAVTVLRYTVTETRGLARLHRVADLADIGGFSILAVHGALIALAAQANIVWAPICAALTVAGGGIITDVLTRREHQAFFGAIYEEIAVLGAVVLLAGLVVANRHEHRPVLVLAAAVVALLATLCLRTVAVALRVRYPEALPWWRRRRARAGTPPAAGAATVNA